MLEPIKHDLKLTDQQVAFIFGLAGLSSRWPSPACLISPLADNYSRTLIIGIGLLILGCLQYRQRGWSRRPAQLLVVRLIGGVGGAGNGPATFSMLGGPVSAAQAAQGHGHHEHRFHGRGRPVVPGRRLSAAFTRDAGVHAAAFSATMRSWQVVFLIMAVPDLLLGVLILFTVHEAKRRGRVATTTPAQSDGRLLPRKSSAICWDNRRAFGPMYIGLASTAWRWSAIRSGWRRSTQRTMAGDRTSSASTRVGVLLILAPAGLLFGGWLAETSRQARHRATPTSAWYCGLRSRTFPFAVAFALVPNPWVALVARVAQHLRHWHRHRTAERRLPGHRAQQDARQDHRHVPVHVHDRQRAWARYLVSTGSRRYVFGDPNKLRYSLALMHAVLGPLAVLVFWKGLRAVRRGVRARAQAVQA